MLKWISAALLAVAVMLGGSPATSFAIAAEALSATPAADATTIGPDARRRYRHHHYAYHPYYPYYYGRPYYYSPGPFFLPDLPSWATGWDWR